MEGILIQILKVLFVLVALVMTFFILLQEGKGGGLAGLGGTKAASVEGVTNPIRRATAVLSVIFFLLAILLGVMARPSGREKSDKLYDTGKPTTTVEAPAAPNTGLDESPAPNTDEKPAAKTIVIPAKKPDEKANQKVEEKTDAKVEPVPAAKATEKPAEKPAAKDAPAPVEKKNP